MFEQVIDKEKKSLTASIKKDTKRVSLDSIINSNISEAYKKYFLAEVKWWIYQDRIVRSSGNYFEITPEIVSEFDALDKLYLKTAFFTKATLAKVIDSAVKVRLNMLCRPVTAMKWFVYRGEPTRTIKEINCRLEYLFDHNYLVRAVKTWIEEQQFDEKQSLTAAEFENAVREMDSNHFLDMGPSEFYDLLVPIFDFFIVTDADKIPIEALIVFSDDKSLGKLTKTLEKMLFRDKITSITKQELIDILTDLFDIKEPSVRPAMSKMTAPDIPEFKAPKNLGSPVTEKADSDTSKGLNLSPDDAETIGKTGKESLLKHEQANIENVAKEVITELDDEEHDLDALAELVLQDESIFDQKHQRKEYKAITDEDLEEDEEDLDDLLSELESTISSSENSNSSDMGKADLPSDLKNELSALVSDLDFATDLDDFDIDNNDSIINKADDFADEVSELDEAEEVISDFADGNDYNPSNELDALEHDPDWDEVEDTLNEEENMQAEKFIPPAEIGLSEETIEEMHKLDDFIVNHKEEFAAEKTYIESDLDSDILLDELEGKHLITIKNDEDEDEIL